MCVCTGLTRLARHVTLKERPHLWSVASSVSPSTLQIPMTSFLAEPTVAFPLVFGFTGGDGLPLHVRRGISAPTLQRMDVIDHVPGTAAVIESGGWTGMHALESILGRSAAVIPAVAVLRTAGSDRSQEKTETESYGWLGLQSSASVAAFSLPVPHSALAVD
jgi:hypothetical protein